MFRGFRVEGLGFSDDIKGLIEYYMGSSLNLGSPSHLAAAAEGRQHSQPKGS